jgi:outer membrane protein assembly factor BamB
MRSDIVGALVVVAAATGGSWLIRAQDETRAAEWRSSGGDSTYKRYSPLAQINRDNVKNLRIVWRHSALDPKLKDLNLPPLGTASRPTALVTKTLLFIGDGSNTFGGIHPSMWGKKFRAYDKATGQVVWETELPAGTTSGPMTYLAADERISRGQEGHRERERAGAVEIHAQEAASNALFLMVRGGAMKSFWYRNYKSSAPRVEDLSTNFVSGGVFGIDNGRFRPQVNASLSYFRDGLGGSHNFKFGTEIMRDDLDQPFRGFGDPVHGSAAASTSPGRAGPS